MSARVAAVLAGLLATLLVAVTPASAVPASQRGEAFNRLEKKVMCIECNVPLNIAEAAQADATRQQIRRLLDRDLSEQQILDQLVEDYGENVLASPKAEGISTLAYAVPVGGLAALLALGAVLLPRWRRNRGQGEGPDDWAGPGDGPDGPGAPDGGPGPGGPSRADRERLDAELARYGR